MRSGFVIVLAYLVGFLSFGAGAPRAADAQSFNLSTPEQNAKLKVQFVGQLFNDKNREYFVGPFGVSLDSEDRVYIADDLAHRVLVLDKSRKLLEVIGEKGNQPGNFAWVDAIVSDRAGNLYVADTGNDRIQIFDRKRRF